MKKSAEDYPRQMWVCWRKRLYMYLDFGSTGPICTKQQYIHGETASAHRIGANVHQYGQIVAPWSEVEMIRPMKRRLWPSADGVKRIFSTFGS